MALRALLQDKSRTVLVVVSLFLSMTLFFHRNWDDWQFGRGSICGLCDGKVIS